MGTVVRNVLDVFGYDTEHVIILSNSSILMNHYLDSLTAYSCS
jgi:hypothetical protein